LDTAFTPMMRDHMLASTIVWELVRGEQHLSPRLGSARHGPAGPA
jgi:hypothetical protein